MFFIFSFIIFLLSEVSTIRGYILWRDIESKWKERKEKARNENKHNRLLLFRSRVQNKHAWWAKRVCILSEFKNRDLRCNNTQDKSNKICVITWRKLHFADMSPFNEKLCKRLVVSEDFFFFLCCEVLLDKERPQIGRIWWQQQKAEEY